MFTLVNRLRQVNTEIAVYENIAFWLRTYSGQLLVDLIIVGPEKFRK